MYGGNPKLGAEEADTFTIGVVVEPIDNLIFSLDFWDIQIDETIAFVGAELAIDQCAQNAQLCGLIHRAPNGNLWVAQTGWVDNLQQNLGEQHWQGIDIAAAYQLNALGGAWQVDLLGTYMLEKETTAIPAEPSSVYSLLV